MTYDEMIDEGLFDEIAALRDEQETLEAETVYCD